MVNTLPKFLINQLVLYFKFVKIGEEVEKYDLIVVGGETIGLYLGLQFLKKGYQVVILEQKEQPGKRCVWVLCPLTFGFLFS